MGKSEFNGSVLGYLGHMLLIGLVSAVTFGIAAPWVIVKYLKWFASHSTIEGKQLKFVGKGGDLFVKCLIWILLMIVTLGIYGFWVPVKAIKWGISNTTFA